MRDELDESEPECRVCRMGTDLPNQKLYTPCLCSGSIGLVHQDCLEAWLAHSNKDKCELCGIRYQFTPQYADNTPTEIPIHVMAYTILKKALKDYIPCILNFLLAIVVWLTIVPFCTCQLFRMWMRLDSFTIAGLQTRIYQDTITGVVLTGFIILTFIVMMSFFDFMRFHGMPEALIRNHRAQQQQQPRQQQIEQQLQQHNYPQEPVNFAQLQSEAQLQRVIDKFNVETAIQNPLNEQHSHATQPPEWGPTTVTEPTISNLTTTTDEASPLQMKLPTTPDNLWNDVLTPVPVYPASTNRIQSDQFNVMTNSTEIAPLPLSSLSLRNRQGVSSKYHLSNTQGNSNPNKSHSDVIDRILVECRRESLGLLRGDIVTTFRGKLEFEIGRKIDISDAESEDRQQRRVQYTSQMDFDVVPTGKHLDLVMETITHRICESYDPSDPNSEANLKQFISDAFSKQKQKQKQQEQVHQQLPQQPKALHVLLPLDPEIEEAERDVDRLENLNANVNNDNDDDEMFEIVDNDAQPGEGDIRLAIDELLGLRNIWHLFRNAWLLLAFNCFYVGLFATFPFIIGLEITRLPLSYFFNPILDYLKMTIPTSISLIETINSLSLSSGDALQFTDCVLIAIGYCVFSVLLFAATYTLRSLRKIFRTRLLNGIVSSLIAAARIVKVGILLFVRVFLLPIYLGVVLLWCSNLLLGYNTYMWAQFIASNLIGAGTLAWVTGISFMVSITLAVLQLREILHPDILSKFIRPQEPHLELLVSLITESGATHFKRICCSMMVYLTIIALFGILPLWIFRQLCVYIGINFVATNTKGSNYSVSSIANRDAVNMTVTFINGTAETVGIVPNNTEEVVFPMIKLYFCYWIPQVQLPLELTLAHLGFLTLLDKKKNLIGRWQFKWLVFIAIKLGLSRYLLPHAMRRIEISRANSDAEQTSTAPSFATDADGNTIVGPPLRRPPPGWDARNGRLTTRWAWGLETPSVLELAVAPRLAPKYWLLRIIALVFITWCLLSSMALGFIFLPIFLGRTILITAQIPTWLLHDPICFVLGSSLLWSAISALSRSNTASYRKALRSIFSMPLKMLGMVIKTSFLWFLVEFGLGIMIHTIVRSIIPSYNSIIILKGSSITSYILSAYFKGSILANIIISSVQSRTFSRTLQLFSYPVLRNNEIVQVIDPEVSQVVEWSNEIKIILAERTQSFDSGVWDRDMERLVIILNKLAFPWVTFVWKHLTMYIIVQKLTQLYVEHQSCQNPSLLVQILDGTVALMPSLVIISWAAPTIEIAIRVLSCKIHAMVIDENYLIGKQLINVKHTGDANTSIVPP